MRGCWLVFALTLYLSLDVANPLMPGAVTFGVDDPVQMRQGERLRVHHDPAARAASFERIGEIHDHEVVMAPFRPLERLRTASPRAPRARSSLLVPSSAPEDLPTLRP